MIETPPGLNQTQLAAIAELADQCVHADGGRLKLEWDVLRHRNPHRYEDLLWWDGEVLVGFCGRYAFPGSTTELSGMVAPTHRRRGIGTALLDAALTLSGQAGEDEVLLVVPRRSTAGQRLAESLGGKLDHSEHALVLTTPPSELPPTGGPAVGLRRAEHRDQLDVLRLTTAAFGIAPGPQTDSEQSLRDENDTWMITVEGYSVGTMRLQEDGTSVGVYGLAIDPNHQGQGIGRRALWLGAVRAFTDGASQVHLEVDVENDRALGLYTSLGFTSQTTEDYWRLQVTG